jgi:hypothetical protein
VRRDESDACGTGFVSGERNLELCRVACRMSGGLGEDLALL